MNRQQTIEAIRVMQSFVDGKPIQGRACRSLQWQNVNDPGWEWLGSDYRIKPEPREFWINHCANILPSVTMGSLPGIMVFDSYESAYKWQPEGIITHVREVLPEEIP